MPKPMLLLFFMLPIQCCFIGIPLCFNYFTSLVLYMKTLVTVILQHIGLRSSENLHSEVCRLLVSYLGLPVFFKCATLKNTGRARCEASSLFHCTAVCLPVYYYDVVLNALSFCLQVDLLDEKSQDLIPMRWSFGYKREGKEVCSCKHN